LTSLRSFPLVYRTCFEPLLLDGETAKRMRFAMIARLEGNEADPPQPMWLLLTNQFLRWHEVADRVIGMQPRDELEAVLPPHRVLDRAAGLQGEVGNVQRSDWGMVRPLILGTQLPPGEQVLLMFAAGQETDRLFEEIMPPGSV
jgi:hypothetical protein